MASVIRAGERVWPDASEPLRAARYRIPTSLLMRPTGRTVPPVEGADLRGLARAWAVRLACQESRAGGVCAAWVRIEVPGPSRVQAIKARPI